MYRLRSVYSLVVAVVLAITTPRLLAAQTSAEGVTGSRFDMQRIGRLLAGNGVDSLMERFHVPGMGLTIVLPDTALSRGYGYRRADRQVRVDADTPFRIASTAKVFVASTVLLSSLDGQIDPDEDVSGLVRSSGPFKGVVTPADLMTHTGGYDERLIGYAARSGEDMQPLGSYLRDHMPDRGWPVGEQISYSNHGMSLAAFAVEEAEGQSFARVAERRLFNPLRMQDTGYLTTGMHPSSNSAEPLECDDAGCRTIPYVFSHAYPAGLAFSTVADMGRFIQAFLHDARTEGPLAGLVPQRYSNDPRIPGMSYGFLNQRYGKVRLLTHAGTVPGFNSLLIVAPGESVGFFLATNGGDAAFGTHIRDLILAALLPAAPEQKPVVRITEDPAVHAGTWHTTRYAHGTIERLPQVFHESIQVDAAGDTLLVIAGGRIRRYLQRDKDLYAQVGGPDLVAFGRRRDEPRMFRSSEVFGASVPMSYEKMPPWMDPGFLNEFISWLLGGPLIVLALIWPGMAVVSRYRRKRRLEERTPRSFISMGSLVLAWGTSFLFAWFGLGFVARSNRMLQTGELFFGMPDTLKQLMWIPAAHAVCVIAFGLAGVLAWKRGWWGPGRRVVFTMLALAFLLQVAFLVRFNYLPISL